MLERDRRAALAGRVRQRKWPILVTAVVLLTGMAYCLAWGPVVRHQGSWVVPGDIWSAYRSAHFIAWGSFGSIYAVGTGIVTFPAILVLFAPLALLTGGLGMTESFPFFPPHPTSWLLLGPYEILLGCSVLFACDALASRLGVAAGRRAILCVAEGVLVWPVLVLWGHPEDALALTLAVYAMVFALDRRWTAAGWLFGLAICTQPLVVLMGPVLLAMSGRRRAPALLLRSALPSVVLLAAPLAAQFHTTTHVLLDQPNFPEPQPRHAVDVARSEARWDGRPSRGCGRSGSRRRLAGGLSPRLVGLSLAGATRTPGVGGGGHFVPALLHRIGHGSVLPLAHPGRGVDRAGPKDPLAPDPRPRHGPGDHGRC